MGGGLTTMGAGNIGEFNPARVRVKGFVSDMQNVSAMDLLNDLCLSFDHADGIWYQVMPIGIVLVERSANDVDQTTGAPLFSRVINVRPNLFGGQGLPQQGGGAGGPGGGQPGGGMMGGGGMGMNPMMGGGMGGMGMNPMMGGGMGGMGMNPMMGGGMGGMGMNPMMGGGMGGMGMNPMMGGGMGGMGMSPMMGGGMGGMGMNPMMGGGMFRYRQNQNVAVPQQQQYRSFNFRRR